MRNSVNCLCLSIALFPFVASGQPPPQSLEEQIEDLRQTDPERAVLFEDRFRELYGEYGFTIGAPPNKNALRALGWSDERIAAAGTELNKIKVNAQSSVSQKHTWSGLDCSGTYKGLHDHVVAINGCAAGVVTSWTYGIEDEQELLGNPKATQCLPCVPWLIDSWPDPEQLNCDAQGESLSEKRDF